MDLVLGPFVDAHAGSLPEGELDRLEALMEEEDTDLLQWVIGQVVPPPEVDSEMIGRLAAFRTGTAP